MAPSVKHDRHLVSNSADPTTGIVRAILQVVSAIPPSSEVALIEPQKRARGLQEAAARKAAAVSGALALPPGPWGLATLIPDLYAVWRIQAQMVADMASLFGKTATLSRDQMMFCLFRHAAAHVVRDLVGRGGKRVVSQRAAVRLLQSIAKKIGFKIAKRMIVKTVARWLPVIGSAGVAAYAYYDTMQVGRTSIGLFQDAEVATDDRSRP